MTVETMHVVGLNLLIFRVMPRFGCTYALALMYSVGLVPAMLKLIFAKRKEDLALRGALFAADMFAMLVQMGAVAVTILIHVLQLGTFRWPDRDIDFMVPPWPGVYWQVGPHMSLNSSRSTGRRQSHCV